MSSFFDYDGTHSDDRFLGNWSDLDWKKFMNFVTIRRFSQGETLVEKGELSRELFVLTQGAIVVDIPQKGAGNLDLSVTIAAGNIVGEQAFIDGLPRSQTLRAKEDGEMMVMSYKSFEYFIAQEPQLGREFIIDVARILSKRLRSTTQKAVSAD